MAKLDDIVTSAVEERVLSAERFHDLLSGWLDHSAGSTAARRETLRQMRGRETALEAGLDRLLDLVTEGIMTATDDSFSRKYAEQTQELIEVKTDIVMLERQLATSKRRITPERLDWFAELVRGAKKALEHAIGRFDAQPGMPVPNIEREWRARLDSNQRPQA